MGMCGGTARQPSPRQWVDGVLLGRSYWAGATGMAARAAGAAPFSPTASVAEGKTERAARRCCARDGDLCVARLAAARSRHLSLHHPSPQEAAAPSRAPFQIRTFQVVAAAQQAVMSLAPVGPPPPPRTVQCDPSAAHSDHDERACRGERPTDDGGCENDELGCAPICHRCRQLPPLRCDRCGRNDHWRERGQPHAHPTHWCQKLAGCRARRNAKSEMMQHY